MTQLTVTRDNQWRKWWKTGGEDTGSSPLENFRKAFLLFATYATIIFTTLVMGLVIVVRCTTWLNTFHWYVTQIDMWGMIFIVLTWTPLGLGLLRYSQRIPLGVKGIVIVLYWSLVITCFNAPADIATGVVVIYYGIMIITASFLLPAWSCLVLAVLYGSVMFFCSWFSHAEIRLFDIAGLTMAGLLSWFTGNVLDASYRSLHALNSSLRESNQSLAAENQQRAKLEVELRLVMADVEKAYRLKSQFLRNVSHEIRTPLTSVIGFANLLQRTELRPEQRDFVKSVRRSSDLLLSLLNDMLDFNKIESQQLKLESIDFNLEYVISSVAKIIRERLQGKAVSLRIEYPDALPRHFKGDPTRVRQIFLNLLGNAVKFTAQGEITVRVDLEGTQRGGTAPLRMLCLTVSDTGIGIPPERREEIFQAFVQGDGSITREYGGTGLGLTITKELVESMGGTITLSSEAGQGSVFMVRISLPDGQPAWDKDFCLPSAQELNGLGALLIEGNPEDRMLLTRYLLDLGIRVAYIAAGAAEALAWFNRHSAEITLILSDTQLLAEGGATFAQTLGRREDRSQFKLIAINLEAQPGNSRLAQLEGFDAYLAKPILQAELNQVILGALGDRRQEKDQIVNRHLMQEFTLHHVSVLVVENHDLHRPGVATLLEKIGCQVETVQNCLEAVAGVRSRKFDLLLLDLRMPDQDGLKAAREIRGSLGLTLPIIALADPEPAADEDECRQAGMNDCLTLPVDGEQLKHKILEWVKG